MASARRSPVRVSPRGAGAQGYSLAEDPVLAGGGPAAGHPTYDGPARIRPVEPRDELRRVDREGIADHEEGRLLRGGRPECREEVRLVLHLLQVGLQDGEGADLHPRKMGEQDRDGGPRLHFAASPDDPLRGAAKEVRGPRMLLDLAGESPEILLCARGRGVRGGDEDQGQVGRGLPHVLPGRGASLLDGVVDVRPRGDGAGKLQGLVPRFRGPPSR